jgi:hypothetical protein
MRTRRLTTALAAAALALGGLGACGGDDETTSVPESDPAGATGATGAGSEQDAEKPASESNQEGAGAGLEQDISGADSDGTDTEAGQQGTIGDTTAE